MNEIAFFFYHRVDDNMFETCVKTLRRHSKCKIVVATDNVPGDMRTDFSRRYDIEWIDVPRERMTGRRAGCKIEVLREFVVGLSENDAVFVSDVDVYFMGDPFEAFDGSFDLGLTTRGYPYYFPINAGVFCLVCNEKTKEWLGWHVNEIHDPKWERYRSLNRRHRQRFGLDWAVGQDFLIACWEARDEIRETRDFVIKDVGPRYNYCPPSDKWFERAFEAIRTAYRDKTHVVLHLKGQLKRILYEGLFEDAVTSHPKVGTDWWGEGKKT